MRKWIASLMFVLLMTSNAYGMVVKATGYFPSDYKSKAQARLEGGKYDRWGIDFDIYTKSDITTDELNLFLSKSGLAGLGGCFKEVEQLYGINAIALAAIAIEESGWGRHCANTNNLVGFKARKKSKQRYAAFKSKEECLHVIGKHLASNYVLPGQRYFHKSSTIRDINHYYCELKSWKNNVGGLINKILTYKNNIRKSVDM